MLVIAERLVGYFWPILFDVSSACICLVENRLAINTLERFIN